MRCFKILAILCMLGTLWSFVTLNLVILAPSVSENVGDPSQFTMAVDNKVVVSSSSKSNQGEVVRPKLSFPNSNEEYFHNPSMDRPKKVYTYHHTIATPDGTEGSVILDMLLGHAYAYHNGGIYGGSCGDGNDVLRGPETALIKTVGLQDFLQFACPRDFKTSERKKVLPSRNYLEDGTRAFTPEYVDLLRSVVTYPERPKNPKANTIVVHIRRGGKHIPCKKKKYHDFEPYLPNKHYQLLIDKYSKDGYDNEVIIYTQSSSHESFDEFKEKGYQLHIDENLSDVWKSVLRSDVFIMSRSSFSFVPAMLATNETKVVYTPYWEQPIRGWDIVRKDIRSQSDAELERLKSGCPKKGKH